MPSFEQFDLSPSVMTALADLGFETPTPVQEVVLPKLLKGTKDLVVLAQTGTGKTAAFGIPVVELADARNPLPQTLVLCPTRELCLQITQDLSAFSKNLAGIKVVAVYGGASIDTQIRAIKKGAQIIVATPGRMNDLIRRNCVKLEAVQQLVLDEADEMLNMGFQEELDAILASLPADVCRLLFSATMSREVASIAGKYMKSPEEIVVGQKNAGSDNVKHECYTVHQNDRYETLKRILDFHRNIYGIVFCRTRAETQEVASALIIDGYSAEAIHGDLTQDQRDRVMKKFRSRQLEILVATDVAARGIDVNELTHVINFNLPDEAESYTHRSGRTGRAGKEGISLIITTGREENKVRTIERIMNKKFNRALVPSGQEVCESQLVGLLDKVKNVDMNNQAMEAFMPMVEAALGDMPAEEALKRLLLLEFNKFLEYYKNAPNLNQKSGGRDRGTPMRQENAVMVGLEINVGSRDQLTTKDLISLVNRATKGPKLPLGRIRIDKDTSIFVGEENAAPKLLANLNGPQFKQFNLSVRMFEGELNIPEKRPAARRTKARRSF
jgi:ATP-dependent RNA helicase DeaD